MQPISARTACTQILTPFPDSTECAEVFRCTVLTAASAPGLLHPGALQGVSIRIRAMGLPSLVTQDRGQHRIHDARQERRYSERSAKIHINPFGLPTLLN